jgi:hypothetical protein
MNALRMLEASIEALENFLDAAKRRAAALNREVIDAAQTNLELGFDFAKSLSRARTLSEIAESQAAYSRKQFDALTAQAEEIRKWLFGFGARESQMPGSSLKRADKVSADARETPTKRRNAPDVTVGALEKKFKRQKSEAAFPTDQAAGLETGRRTQKRRVLKVEPEPLQKLRTRDASAGRGKQKPETATKAKGRRPSPDRGRRSDAERTPVARGLPMEIKFGMLDGNAVRFTDFEAWLLVDGIWRPMSPDEVVPNAVEMREARFDQLFPQVPRLPSNAFGKEVRESADDRDL